MDRFTAFFDANVLYPAALRNLLMRLALRGLFRAKWSYRVHEEWIEDVLRNRPDLTPEKLERTRDLMNQHLIRSLGSDQRKIMISLKSKLDFGVIWPLNSHFGARITHTKHGPPPSLVGVRSPTALPPRFQGRNVPGKLRNRAVSRPNFHEVQGLGMVRPHQPDPHQPDLTNSCIISASGSISNSAAPRWLSLIC